MTTTTTTSEQVPLGPSVEIRPRKAGFAADLLSVAGRAVRRLPREPESIVPALIVPVFFYVVNVAALGSVAEDSGTVGDFRAFQLPVAIIFAVTGVSQANALVTDIQDGYFDRLLLTPIRRVALLLGLMVADLVLVMALTLPVLALGFAYGVRFETGVLGVLAFIVLSGVWGVVFTGFPYAIALKTGNPGAVAGSFILFFPFAFLTTSFLPKEALSGWLSAVATVNPVTYLLEGLRALISDGWVAADLGAAVLAVLGVGVVSMGLALATLRGRVKRG
jgi:ABC-2 type transport system permease protein